MNALMATCRRFGIRDGEGKALTELGDCHVKKGFLEDTLSFYQKRLAIRKELGDRDGEAGTLVNVGITSRRQFGSTAQGFRPVHKRQI